jgi:hypothetical protein
MDVRLGETVTIDFMTYNADGVPTDAAATPSVAVFEDDADTPSHSPAAAKRSDQDGHYRIALAATEDNGYAAGKSYNVKVSATVGELSSAATVARFVLRDAQPVVASVAGDVGGKVLGGGEGAITGVGVRGDVRLWMGDEPSALSSGLVQVYLADFDVSLEDTSVLGVNVIQIDDEAVSAASPVTFPASIGTSTFAGGAVASVTGSVGSVTAPVTVTGTPAVNVTQFGGSAGAFAGGRPEVNATHWGGTAVGSANVRSNVVQVAGQTASAAAGVTFPASIGTSTFDHTSNSVTVGTNTDKTGYSLTQAFPTNFSSLGITPSGYIERVVLVDTTTTNTDMRGTDGANTTTPPTADAVAQAVYRRDAASDDGNAAEHSLYTVIQAVKNFSTTATPGSLVIYRTNGTTVHTTIPLDTDATAEAIVSAGIS